MDSCIESNKIDLLSNLDYLYSKEAISKLSVRITRSEYFTFLNAHFMRMLSGGGGDGFCDISFHSIQPRETADDFIKKCVDTKVLLTARIYVAVYDGERPPGWYSNEKITTFRMLLAARSSKVSPPTNFVCLSLEELGGVAKMEIRRKNPWGFNF